MKRKLDRRNVEEGDDRTSGVHEHGDIRGDEKNIAILLFMYLMQGIPIGLCNAIPIILLNRGASYRQQV